MYFFKFISLILKLNNLKIHKLPINFNYIYFLKYFYSKINIKKNSLNPLHFYLKKSFTSIFKLWTMEG